MKKYGFYCRMYGKDCFIETTQIKKSKKLTLDFINKVQNELNRFSNITEHEIEKLQERMRRASFEVKTITNGNFAGLGYYEIMGENFGYGCDACENPMEYCVIVKM